jgi:hypothetical protein
VADAAAGVDVNALGSVSESVNQGVFVARLGGEVKAKEDETVPPPPIVPPGHNESGLLG